MLHESMPSTLNWLLSRCKAILSVILDLKYRYINLITDFSKTGDHIFIPFEKDNDNTYENVFDIVHILLQNKGVWEHILVLNQWRLIPINPVWYDQAIIPIEEYGDAKDVYVSLVFFVLVEMVCFHNIKHINEDDCRHYLIYNSSDNNEPEY